MANRPTLAALCALAVTTLAGPALAQDVYIGTVDVQKDQVILTRCDLADNRYVLRDQKGQTLVAKLRERLKTLKAPVYAEVFGQYVEVPDEDGNGLDVIGLEHVTAGKSCHLADALPSR
ncbi:hypothetical protein [Caulobacter soli]|uniref:hypothetical protein n=1 Tax=Caulobacter soli TaxID=2708539 RepID=UPI0013EDC11E|nr:hypothetical protein [Caulobacter soli]